MVKIFVYLSDVHDVESGPFTLLPKGASKKIRGSFFHRHMPDAEITAQIGNVTAVARQIFAPRFSIFMVDTSVCYHMGSRMAPGRTRLLYTATFSSAPPIYTNFDNRIRITKPLSRFLNLVLKYDA